MENQDIMQKIKNSQFKGVGAFTGFTPTNQGLSQVVVPVHVHECLFNLFFKSLQGAGWLYFYVMAQVTSL